MLDKIYFASYVNNNTPYTKNENVNQLIRNIEEIYASLLNLFKDDRMKVNCGKCNLLLHGNKDRPLNIGNELIRNTPN